jgi:hypothetical protein
VHSPLRCDRRGPAQGRAGAQIPRPAREKRRFKIKHVLPLLSGFDGSGSGVRYRFSEILESLGSYVGVTLQGLQIRGEAAATKAHEADESTGLFGLSSTMQTLSTR